ncbi:hypothetical protein BKA80DRAFT_147540 [Phyllosticta citrichinensis]
MKAMSLSLPKNYIAIDDTSDDDAMEDDGERSKVLDGDQSVAQKLMDIIGAPSLPTAPNGSEQIIYMTQFHVYMRFHCDDPQARRLGAELRDGNCYMSNLFSLRGYQDISFHERKGRNSRTLSEKLEDLYPSMYISGPEDQKPVLLSLTDAKSLANDLGILDMCRSFFSCHPSPATEGRDHPMWPLSRDLHAHVKEELEHMGIPALSPRTDLGEQGHCVPRLRLWPWLHNC